MTKRQRKKSEKFTPRAFGLPKEAFMLAANGYAGTSKCAEYLAQFSELEEHRQAALIRAVSLYQRAIETKKRRTSQRVGIYSGQIRIRARKAEEQAKFSIGERLAIRREEALTEVIVLHVFRTAYTRSAKRVALERPMPGVEAEEGEKRKTWSLLGFKTTGGNTPMHLCGERWLTRVYASKLWSVVPMRHFLLDFWPTGEITKDFGIVHEAKCLQAHGRDIPYNMSRETAETILTPKTMFIVSLVGNDGTLYYGAAATKHGAAKKARVNLNGALIKRMGVEAHKKDQPKRGFI